MNVMADLFLYFNSFAVSFATLQSGLHRSLMKLLTKIKEEDVLKMMDIKNDVYGKVLNFDTNQSIQDLTLLLH